MVLAVLAVNAVLALLGMWVVPAILRWPAGLGAMLGAAGAQFAVAIVAVFGPTSVDSKPWIAGICLALGTLFAFAYLGILAADFADIHLSFGGGPVTIYSLFGGVAVAGTASG